MCEIGAKGIALSAIFAGLERRGGTLHAAFTGSAPADFRSGIEKGDDPQKFTFTPNKAGEYAIVCGVPSHVDAGM